MFHGFRGLVFRIELWFAWGLQFVCGFRVPLSPFMQVDR